MICLHAKCGCLLEMKARWESESCPKSLWPAIQSEPPPASPPETS
jgi:hypothetical protein